MLHGEKRAEAQVKIKAQTDTDADRIPTVSRRRIESNTAADWPPPLPNEPARYHASCARRWAHSEQKDVGSRSGQPAGRWRTVAHMTPSRGWTIP